MRKMITLLAAVALMATDAQAQAVTQKPVQTVTEAPAQAASATTTTESQTQAAPAVRRSYGLYEEELPRSVKRISTTRTVKEEEAPAAQPLESTTTELTTTPAPRGNLSSQMAPPERASGKKTTTRVVRTITPATTPAATETEENK